MRGNISMCRQLRLLCVVYWAVVAPEVGAERRELQSVPGNDPDFNWNHFLGDSAVSKNDDHWLEPIDVKGADVEADEGALTIPVFPLSLYLPYDSPVLTIFEPRYRKMYNDILFNGARRFAVVNVRIENERDPPILAEVGTIFYLEDLQEISRETQDRFKYVGTHSVIGRVRLKKILNPSAAGAADDYLRAQVEEIVDVEPEDEAESAAIAAEQLSLEKLVDEIIEMQGRLEVWREREREGERGREGERERERERERGREGERETLTHLFLHPYPKPTPTL